MIRPGYYTKQKGVTFKDPANSGYIIYNDQLIALFLSMNNSELLKIAREACAYAREHIKQGETTPGAKGNLEQKVAEMRTQADKLWEAFCKYKGVDEHSERGQSIRTHALELFVLEKEIGNCGEFVTLAFHYIQKNYPQQLAEMNLTVLGVNGSTHIVVSLGNEEDRVICDPTMDIVFEFNKEPEKLHDYSQSRGKNTYYPYFPEYTPLRELVLYNPEGALNQEELEELSQFKREGGLVNELPSTHAGNVEENLGQEQTFEQICAAAIATTYTKPAVSASPEEKLKYDLQCYIKVRSEEAEAVLNEEVSYDETNTNPQPLILKYKIMWWKSRFNAEDKICTAKKVIDKLDGINKNPITARELEILKDGRLGATTKPFLDILQAMCET